MVQFTGGAGPVDGVGSIFEWSDVIVVRDANEDIVDYFTQFSGDALPGSGTPVEIGGSFDVQLTSLTYRHLGDPVGAGTLDIANGAQFRQAATNFTMSGKLTNNGSMTVHANTIATGAIENNNLMTVGTADTNIKFLLLKPVDGDFNISGSGDIRLRDGFISGQGGESSVTDLFNSSKITGYGQIGADFGRAYYNAVGGGYLTVTNTAAGTIEANVDGKTLFISTQLSALNPIVNAGLLAASGGGTMQINGSIEQSGAGTIKAFNNSTVALNNVVLTGGTLDGEGSGVVQVDYTKLSGIDITETATVNLGQFATLHGFIENRGEIVARTYNSIITIDGLGVVFSGGGSFQLSESGGFTQVVGAAGAILTNLDHTIFGKGAIVGADLAIVNSGVIAARPDAASATDTDLLRFDQISSITNGLGGVLEASGAATLQLINTRINNEGGTIRADGAGAVVYMDLLEVKGGSIVSEDGGVIDIYRATWDGSSSAVTSNADMTLDNLRVLTLKGDIVNSGDVSFSYRSHLTIGEDTTLSGGGSFTINRGFEESSVRGVAGKTLTNIDNTFAGADFFGGNSGFLFVNGAAGVVTANQVGNTLRVETGNVITNNGVMSANGGILDVIDNVVGTGRLEVTNGGTLLVDQGTDQRVVFVGGSADTLYLRLRESGGGGFDFTIADMGVGDRVKVDIGRGNGDEAPFAFSHEGDVTTLRSTAFMNGAEPFAIHLLGDYSEGQFQFIGGADNALGLVRVASRDGTNADETMTATAGGERLVAFGGDDMLVSGAGDDVLDGARGNDTADYSGASSGLAVDLAARGDQNVGGGLGLDRLYNIENLIGSAHNDTLLGTDAANSLFGRLGVDTLVGGLGDDVLDGGGAADFMLGGDGDDTYLVDDTFDFIDEGYVFPQFGFGGTDTVLSTANWFWDVYGIGERLVIAETASDPTGAGTTIIGGVFDNDIVGNSKNNVLFGRGGSDTYAAGDGIDFISLNLLGVEGLYDGVDGVNTVIVDERASGAFSYDIVFDFESGKDKVDVSDYGFANAAAAFATGVNDGAGSSYFVLGDGLDYLYMVGLTLEEMTAGDFIV